MRKGPLESLKALDLVAPKDHKIWAFAFLLRLSEVTGIRQVKALFKFMFVELAPSIPVSLRRSITGAAGLQSAILGAVITLIFCLLVPIGWTIAIGRFSSDKPGNLFLLQDATNLVLYSIVCPLYVGLGCWLAVAVIKGWADIKEFASTLGSKVEKPSRATLIKNLLLVILILSMGFFSTAAYINDIMKPDNVPQRYWFMDLSRSGEHILGALGVYYFLLTFVLLIVTLISITLFMSIFVSVMAVGDALESRTQPTEAELPVLEAKLSTFTEAYILAKTLTFVYMVNFYLWQKSPLGATQNIYVAVIFLTLFGVLFVSLPRYFVELQWYRFLVRSKQVRIDEDVYEDIRPYRIRTLASIMDDLLIGGFVITVLTGLLSGVLSSSGPYARVFRDSRVQSTYTVAVDLCYYEPPAQLASELGVANDREVIARAYSMRSTESAHREAAYIGCLKGLSGLGSGQKKQFGH